MSRTSADFAHQVVVDVRTACRIQHQHVVAAEPCGIERAAGDLLRRLSGDNGQRIDSGLLAEHTQLLLCRRPARVERGHQHLLLVAIRQALGDLGAGGGLARSLQAHEHDRHGRRRGDVYRLGIGAQHGDQLVVHDLDHHLAGRDGLHDLLADGLSFYFVRERAHDIERHVGFEQCATHLTHGLRDIGLTQRPALGEPVQDIGEPFRK